MLDIWKGATDNNKTFGALLTDLSKAFDCLRHDLFIAKLHTLDSLNILQNYSSNRKQITVTLEYNNLWSTSRLSTRTTFVQHIYV